MQIPGGASLTLAPWILGYTLDLPRSAFAACIAWHCGSSEGSSRGWFLAPRCAPPSRWRCLGVWLFKELYTLVSLSSTPCGRILKHGPVHFPLKILKRPYSGRCKSFPVGSRLLFIHRAWRQESLTSLSRRRRARATSLMLPPFARLSKHSSYICTQGICAVSPLKTQWATMSSLVVTHHRLEKFSTTSRASLAVTTPIDTQWD